jgi:regulatory protein
LRAVLLEESIALNFGENRIVNELKFRNIGQYNINLALKEISNEEYLDTFDKIALQNWDSIKETNLQKKRNSVITYSKGLKAT